MGCYLFILCFSSKYQSKWSSAWWLRKITTQAMFERLVVQFCGCEGEEEPEGDNASSRQGWLCHLRGQHWASRALPFPPPSEMCPRGAALCWLKLFAFPSAQVDLETCVMQPAVFLRCRRSNGCGSTLNALRRSLEEKEWLFQTRLFSLLW